MNEKKLKHLEFIQNVITRMNSNSFLIKGWTITIVSALFALAAQDSNLKFVIVAYIALPVFWILDGFFIAIEKRYRNLYSEVAQKKEEEIDFSMDCSKFIKNDTTWFAGVFSKTLIPFYGIALFATLIRMFFI